MSRSKDLFIDLRMREEAYENLPREYRDEMEVLKVDEYKPKYPDDPVWLTLDEESKKIYWKKKQREFKLRNKQ